MRFSLALTVAFVWVLSQSLRAATPVYYPSPDEFIAHQTLGATEHKEVYALFTNPAIAGMNPKVQAMFSHQVRLLDYNHVQTGLSIPIEVGTLAIGMDTTSANDIDAVSDAAFAPKVTGSLEDAYRTYSAAFSLRPIQGQSVGVRMNSNNRALGSDKASGLSLDLGYRYQLTKDATVGAYARNLLQLPLRWSSGLEESLPMEWTLHGNMRFDSIDTGIAFIAKDQGKKMALDAVRVSGEWGLNPDVQVFGQSTSYMNNLNSFYSIGASFDFRGLILSTTYHAQETQAISESWSQMGLHARL